VQSLCGLNSAAFSLVAGGGRWQVTRKLPEPTFAAEHIALNLIRRCKENKRVELPIKTSDCHLVAVNFKLTVGSSNPDEAARFDVKIWLLAISALENVKRGSGVELGVKPH
jgi:hypothetical protein